MMDEEEARKILGKLQEENVKTNIAHMGKDVLADFLFGLPCVQKRGMSLSKERNEVLKEWIKIRKEKCEDCEYLKDCFEINDGANYVDYVLGTTFEKMEKLLVKPSENVIFKIPRDERNKIMKKELGKDLQAEVLRSRRIREAVKTMLDLNSRSIAAWRILELTYRIDMLDVYRGLKDGDIIRVLKGSASKTPPGWDILVKVDDMEFSFFNIKSRIFGSDVEELKMRWDVFKILVEIDVDWRDILKERREALSSGELTVEDLKRYLPFLEDS